MNCEAFNIREDLFIQMPVSFKAIHQLDGFELSTRLMRRI